MKGNVNPQHATESLRKKQQRKMYIKGKVNIS